MNFWKGLISLQQIRVNFEIYVALIGGGKDGIMGLKVIHITQNLLLFCCVITHLKALRLSWSQCI